MSTTTNVAPMTDADIARRAAFLAQVTTIVDAGGARLDSEAESIKHYRERQKTVRESLNDSTNLATGFDSARFTMLEEIALAFVTAYGTNDGTFGPHAEAAIPDAIKLWEGKVNANRTGKTAKGGTDAGLRQIILLGQGARAVRRAIASRLNYWSQIHANPPGDGSEKSAQKELAARYCQLAVKDKHVGGPSGTVNGVHIGNPDGSPRGSTNRTAQITALSRLYAAHGDKVLDSAVVDYLLDNGGKCDKVETREDVCDSILAGIDSLLNAHGGIDSADAGMLYSMQGMARQWRERGFAAKVAATPIAAAVAPAIVNPAPPAPPAPAAEGPTSPALPGGKAPTPPDASAVLGASVSDLTGLAPAAPAKPERKGKGSMAA